MWGGELVLRDGIAVGQVTSAAWAASVGACVGLAYLRDPDGGPVTKEFVATGPFDINVGGELVAADMQLKAPYDLTSERVKG
jgi:glycine cleavage system aminomethyltransferase T